MPLLTYKKPVSFIRVPIATKGRLFASPMPYGPYDTGKRLLKTYIRNRVHTVVILTTPSEMDRKASKDIRVLYLKNDLDFLHCPIQDYTAPTLDVLTPLIRKVVTRLEDSNVVVHCNAGVGRTGVVLASTLCLVEGITPDVAFDRLMAVMEIRITEEQRRMVCKWYEIEHARHQ